MTHASANAPPEEERTPHYPTPDTQPHSAFANWLGQKAFDNREWFTSAPGHILARNMLRTAVAIVPTAMGFVGARYFNKYYTESTLTGGVHKFLKPLMKETISQQSLYVFSGFTPFRAACRMEQRAYDRVFAATDPDKAAAQVEAMPGNAWRDLKEILPAEALGTAMAAPVLAGIKMHYKTPEPPLTGNLALARKNFPNDYLASLAGYIPFFEFNDRVYDAVSDGKDCPEYYARLQCRELPQEPEHKKFGFFTNDGLGRVAFRRVGSLVVGLAPYLYLQRTMRAAGGEVVPGQHSVVSNLVKSYRNYVGFATYTGSAELYNMGYDRLFHKLEQKYQEQGQAIS